MKILLVDDDPLSRKSLAKFLGVYLNQTVVEAENGQIALKEMEKCEFSLVVSDIKMPVMDGLELLKRIKNQISYSCEVILTTGFADLNSAIFALKNGAFDYLQKPVNIQELADIVHKVQENINLKKVPIIKDNDCPPQSNDESHDKLDIGEYYNVFGLGRIGVFSYSMKKVIQLVKTYHENREVSVLIQGETGTGKEVIARMIHDFDNKEKRPFVTLNCSAVSSSLFESELFGYETGAFTGAAKHGSAGKLEIAQGGTIFLDEIGDMPLDMQPKLLRAIQMREVSRVGSNKALKLDLRIICATNRNLEEMVVNGTFRQDLYYRISAGKIYLPALRERKEDIIPLVKMFIDKFAKEKNKKLRLLSKEAEYLMNNYSWPGNIRELQNTIERIVLLSDSIELKVEQLSFLFEKTDYFPELINSIEIKLPEKSYNYLHLERDILEKILLKFKGNKTKAAEYLGITRNRLNRKIQ